MGVQYILLMNMDIAYVYFVQSNGRLRKKVNRMKAFQCDRCHGFYSEKIQVDAELSNKTYENVNVFHDKVLTYEPLDLCPNCKESLLEWLKCKEGEKNE